MASAVKDKGDSRTDLLNVPATALVPGENTARSPRPLPGAASTFAVQDAECEKSGCAKLQTCDATIKQSGSMGAAPLTPRANGRTEYRGENRAGSGSSVPPALSALRIHLVGGPRHAETLLRPPCVQIVFGEHRDDAVLHCYKRTVFRVRDAVLFRYAGCSRLAPPSGLRAVLLSFGCLQPRRVTVEA